MQARICQKPISSAASSLNFYIQSCLQLNKLTEYFPISHSSAPSVNFMKSRPSSMLSWTVLAIRESAPPSGRVSRSANQHSPSRDPYNKLPDRGTHAILPGTDHCFLSLFFMAAACGEEKSRVDENQSRHGGKCETPKRIKAN